MPEIAVTRPETLCIPHRLSSWTYPDMRANRVKSLSKYRVHSELPQAALVRLSPAVRDWKPYALQEVNLNAAAVGGRRQKVREGLLQVLVKADSAERLKVCRRSVKRRYLDVI